MVSSGGEWIDALRAWLWAGPISLMFLVVAVLLNVRIPGLSLRSLGAAASELSKRAPGDDRGGRGLTSLEALMTGLAGAIGTGNIAGVAVALSLGGPGALFWMWVAAILGMAIAYGEGFLAVRWRRPDSALGGCAIWWHDRLGRPWIGTTFAVLALAASFGIGSTIQANSVAQGLGAYYGISPQVSGVGLVLTTLIIVSGGVRWIGKTASVLIPVMSSLYLGCTLWIVLTHAAALPHLLGVVVREAFGLGAAGGGLVGVGIALQHGAAAGVFASEAGMGSLGLAAAAAKDSTPRRQGLLALGGVFFAVIILCTMTGLSLLLTVPASGWDNSTGASLTVTAFSQVKPWMAHVVVASLVVFAFTTTVAWVHYGERCLTWIGGSAAPQLRLIYFVLFLASIYWGAVEEVAGVWAAANLANGLMAIPNLWAVARLRHDIEW